MSESDRADFLILLQHQSTAKKEPAKAAAPPAVAVVDPNQPKVKLKNIFWSKLGGSDVKGTIWTAVVEHKLSDKNRSLIETWFASKITEGPGQARRSSLPGGVGAGTVGGGGGAVAAAKEPSAPKLVSVLDGKRTQVGLMASPCLPLR